MYILYIYSLPISPYIVSFVKIILVFSIWLVKISQILEIKTNLSKGYIIHKAVHLDWNIYRK